MKKTFKIFGNIFYWFGLLGIGTIGLFGNISFNERLLLLMIVGLELLKKDE